VDHHADLAVAEPERFGDVLVVDVLDRLNLQEMVARPQAAELPEPTLLRADADGCCIGVGYCALVFAALQVAGGSVAAFDRVPRAVGQDLLELGPAGEAVGERRCPPEVSMMGGHVPTVCLSPRRRCSRGCGWLAGKRRGKRRRSCCFVTSLVCLNGSRYVSRD
jgi:hypothetical protein